MWGKADNVAITNSKLSKSKLKVTVKTLMVIKKDVEIAVS